MNLQRPILGWWGGQRYVCLTENANEKQEAQRRNEQTERHWRLGTRTLSVVVAGLLALSALLMAMMRSNSTTCVHPPTRREWRALTAAEREEFLRAVVCLSEVPSTWTGNGTRYDDFTHLHASIGSWSHRSASFLPWHRWALHLWETDLRQHCGFQGQIPYWDWTLDWMDLASSSIWDGATGFGGDGDKSLPKTVGGGSCVTDGPFAHLRPIMYADTYEPHCLSRGFNFNGTAGRLPSEPFSPETIGPLTRLEPFEVFARQVEWYLHGKLHDSVGGDFPQITAANDPIFFVHHVQLDRVWWRWQKEHPQARLHDYGGYHMFNSTEPDATLADLLMFGGFSEDVPVSRVMSTESQHLCYKY